MLVGLVALVDYKLVLASIQAADSKLILASFALLPVLAVLESGRLRIVFASFGLSNLDSLRLYFVGVFFGNFMPGQIGTDIYQIYHMHTIRPGLLRPVSLSVFLRLNGLLINLLLAVAAVSFGTKTWMGSAEIHWDHGLQESWTILSALSVLFVVMIMLASRWGRGCLHSLWDKAFSLFREFHDSVRSFTVYQHIAITVFGLLIVLSRAAIVYFLLQAFGSSVAGVDIVLTVTVATLAALLPIGFGGLGVREISLAALLMAFGVDASNAVAISLVSRFFIWFFSLLGGAWFVIDSKSGKPRE